MAQTPLVSIIIPCNQKQDLCPQLLPAINSQTYPHHQTIIIDDSTLNQGPAAKRDLGANQARGTILAFIDADAYPDKHWLKQAVKLLLSQSNLAAVCGPGLTPPTNTYRQQISGLVWSTWLGAGGAGVYRNKKQPQRYVDDYPSYNLLVHKKDFQAVNGFNSKFWPGEDTKLCHDLVYALKKKILYHPKLVVFHHRRPIFIPHLKQISRYGLHRGFFTKTLPRTSLRLGYFIPLIFLLSLVTFPHLSLPPYLFLLLLTSLKHHNLLLAPAIFLTHLTYALFFLRGLLSLNPRQ